MNLNKEIRLIKLPNVFTEETKQDITDKEILLATMLQFNSFNNRSRTILTDIEEEYNFSYKYITSFIDILPNLNSKGLLQVVNIDDVKHKSSRIVTVAKNYIDNYVAVDRNLIEAILYSDRRANRKAKLVRVLYNLQHRAGYRDFNSFNSSKGYCFPSYERIAKDINTSKSVVIECIKDLEELGIITVVRHEPYTTVNKDNQEYEKQHSNTYIVNQVNYTKENIQVIVDEILDHMYMLEQEAIDKQIKSRAISKITEDDYNDNKDNSHLNGMDILIEEHELRNKGYNND